MDTQRVVIAIEPSSSKITGAAALKDDDGKMKLLAAYSVPADNGVRYGSVYNLDTTSQAVVAVVDKLEKLIDTTIEKVYIGIQGMSLHSVPVSVLRDLSEEDNVITEALLDNMAAESDSEDPEGYLSLGIVSQEFRTDHKNTVEHNPKGVVCRHVEGTFQRMLITHRNVSKLMECFKRANVEVIDSFIQPVAVADIVLSQDEKQRGCTLVDYGAQTVTVSVYKGGKLRKLKVIPLGSASITADIAAILKIDLTEAERLKKTYGLIGTDSEDIISIGERQVPVKYLAEICDARNEEIFRNVSRQIHSTGLADSLLSGIVLTGGGANLAGLGKAVRNLMPDIKSVRFATAVPDGIELDNSSLDPQDGSLMGVLGLLNGGYDNCCTKPGILDMYENITAEEESKMVIGDLFGLDGESAQPKYDEIYQKHAEQKAAAEKQNEARKEENTKHKESTLLTKIRGALDKFFDDVQ